MSFVLDLTRGQARVRQVVFNRGQPRPTVSIGRAAAWSLVADDLEDVHAFVSFDGAALMVRSAEENNPAWLDGRAVPCAWTPVGRASILALGNARITVTAKEDHVRPGGDDDEVTGQIEMPVPAARPSAPAARDPRPLSATQGDEEEVTGEIADPRAAAPGAAAAPVRGLLPKPRVPPRASAPAPLPVPQFEDPTQLRSRDRRSAAAPPAPPPPADDDEERTNAIDIQAMQAAQAAQRSARPARPNIAIATETDEATRMLPLDRPEPARSPPIRPIVRPPPASVPPFSAAPINRQPLMPSSPPPEVETAARETVPPASGATQLRPMTTPPFRPPNAGNHRLREETLIDPFAATGGNPTVPRGAPAAASERHLAAAALVVPGAPGTADVTGPIGALPPNTPAPPPEAKAGSRSKTTSQLLTGVSLGVLIWAGYVGYGLLQHRGAPSPTAQTVRPPTVVVPAAPEGGASVPVVAAAVVSDAASPMVTPTRNALPVPEFPHKGALDAGAPLDPMVDGGLATMQRAAVDAVAEGDLGRAILFYEQLATLEPDVRAYSAAARILRAQMVADAGAGRRF